MINIAESSYYLHSVPVVELKKIGHRDINVSTTLLLKTIT